MQESYRDEEESLERRRGHLANGAGAGGSVFGEFSPLGCQYVDSDGEVSLRDEGIQFGGDGDSKGGANFQECSGGNHSQAGRALLLLASVYERQGPKITPYGTSKDDVELELYVDALEPLKAALGHVHDNVGFLYVKIGYLYGKGDRNMAILAYKAALKSCGEPSFGLSPESVHPEVVSVWVHVTEHLVEIKFMSEAVVAGQRALFLLGLNSLFRGAKLHCHSGDASIGFVSTTNA